MKKEFGRKIKLFPFLIFIITMLMGIGYATVTSVSLDVKGTAVLKEQNGISITDVKYQSDINAVLENSTIKNVYQTTLSSSIQLSSVDPNSSITYSITVHNYSNDSYYFQGVNYYNDEFTYSNANIIYTLNNINVGDKINSKESLTFTITFSYKDNLIAIENTLDSYLNFVFKKKFTVNYADLINIDNYPIEVYEGETLTVDLTPSNPLNINVYMGGTIIRNYTFENKIVTIPNISSNITIQGIIDNNYDVPVTDNDTNFIIVDSSSGETVNVRDLFELQFSGINGSTRKITKIELIVNYSSTTGSKQSIISTLTHNSNVYEQQLAFEGKVNDGTLTIVFDNLSIGIYDVFKLSNTNEKLTNGSITIHSEELKIYFEEVNGGN